MRELALLNVFSIMIGNYYQFYTCNELINATNTPMIIDVYKSRMNKTVCLYIFLIDLNYYI